MTVSDTAAARDEIPQEAIEAMMRAGEEAARAMRFLMDPVSDAAASCVIANTTMWKAALAAAAPFLRAAVVEECAKVLREHAHGEDELAILAKGKGDLFDEAEHRTAAAAIRSVVPAIRSLSPTGGAR